VWNPTPSVWPTPPQSVHPRAESVSTGMDPNTPTGSVPASGENVPKPVIIGGRYELGPLIGRGGSGAVYRGLDRSLHQRVAIKMLYTGQGHPGQAARFEREARLHATFHHPHVIPLLDAGHETDRHYLVMPLIEGTTLADRIAVGPIPEPEVQRLGAALAQALAYIHAHGVAHRDVKPSNILIGRAGWPLLTDFGIARAGASEDTATMPGFVTGTVAYIAPEQFEGHEAGFACDVYSLGLVLLEALTGVRAFPSHGTLLEQALARLWRLPTVPVSLAPGWQELIRAMTALDPAHRPAPHAVAAILAGPLDSAQTVSLAVPSLAATAKARSGAQPPAKPARRRRWAAPVLGALCASALTASALTIMTASPNTAGAAAPPPAAQITHTTHTAKRSTVADTTPAPAKTPQPTVLTPVDDASPLHSSTPTHRSGNGRLHEHRSHPPGPRSALPPQAPFGRHSGRGFMGTFAAP